MPIVEYKLHKVGKNAMRAPEWVDDGGYWQNPADKTLVGWVLAEADRDYYIPDTVTELSKSDFVTRLQTIHADAPYTKGDPGEKTNMTNEEVATMAGEWYDNFHA